MREIVMVNIGQSGVQLSNAAWELFCIEHGIQANGLLKEHLSDSDSKAFQTCFQEVPTGQFVPRAISVDLEPTVLDEVRTGAYRNLWHPDQLISGSEDAANNYARGHFTHGKLLIDVTINTIRKAVDMCDMVQGFFIINSYGGGTGSGLAALILERIGVEYTKRSKFQFGVVPSNHMSTAVVEPYNALLSLNSSTEHAELCDMIDNESVYSVCTKLLDIARPTYNNINRVLAQVFSSLTVSLRYESVLNSDFDQINTNLIPFPRIHYPVCNLAPIVSARRAEHEKSSTHEITRAVFDDSSSMISIKMDEGKYIACCLQYRGDVTPKDVNTAIFEIKRRTDVKFVEWCPTGFKLGINCQPPTAVPGSELAQTSRSLTMLTNTTAISQVWTSVMNKFDLLFSKRSFVHWYVGEGMEEGEFNEAKDEMASLLVDYEEIAADEADTGANATSEKKEGSAYAEAGSKGGSSIVTPKPVSSAVSPKPSSVAISGSKDREREPEPEQEPDETDVAEENEPSENAEEIEQAAENNEEYENNPY